MEGSTTNTRTSTVRRKANSLIVSETNHGDDCTVLLSPGVFKSFATQIESHYYILVTARLRQKALFFAEEVPNDVGDEQYAGFTRLAMSNLRVSIGDLISVEATLYDGRVEHVILRPITDTFERLRVSPAEVLRELGYRDWIARSGDRMSLRCHSNVYVEFFVEAVAPAPFGVVNFWRKVVCGKPLSRVDADAGRLTGYDSIGGYHKQMSQIREMIELPLRCPQLFASVGITAPRSLLLYGPPGCGKSLITQAIANETGSSLFMVDGFETVAQSDPRSSLQTIFDQAEHQENTPSIIVIDNIDFIAPNREKTDLRHEQQAHAAILHCINSLRYRSDVVVIAITSNLENVDTTLRRFGRLGYEVYIGAPDLDDRLSILRIHSRSLRLAEDVSLEVVAAQTVGYVGSDLAALCFIASMRRIRNTLTGVDVNHDIINTDMLNTLQVTMQDFESALSFIVNRNI